MIPMTPRELLKRLRTDTHYGPPMDRVELAEFMAMPELERWELLFRMMDLMRSWIDTEGDD